MTHSTAGGEPAAGEPAGGEPVDVLAGWAVGAALPALRVTVSPAANERFWRAAGVDHASLRAGALYPPIAANLVIMTVQQVDAAPLLHTRQQLLCHRSAQAPAELAVNAVIRSREVRRGRAYTDVEATIDTAEGRLWTAVATFTRLAPPSRRTGSP